MERKEFLRKTLQVGLVSGSMLMMKGKKALAQSEGKKSPQKKDPGQKFKELWLAALFQNMDEHLDEKTRTELMEACGRDCARRGAIRMAEASQGNMDKLVTSLAGILKKENCYRKDNKVYLTYPQCFCELVNHGPDRLPDTYCECSKGWLLEIFETVQKKPVKVEMLQTVKQGASSCKFVVYL